MPWTVHKCRFAGTDASENYWYMPAPMEDQATSREETKEYSDTKDVSVQTVIQNTDQAILQASPEYWMWSTNADRSAEPNLVMRQLLEEELARHILSVDHIQETLRQAIASTTAKTVHAAAPSDDYWAVGS